MKFSSKSDFTAATDEQWCILWEHVDCVDTSANNRRSVTQVLSHLYAWHRMLESWYREGMHGMPDLPATGYKWNQTVALNKKLDEQYKDLDIRQVKRRLKLSHRRIMKLVESMTETQFNEPGQWAWTGKNALSSYVVPNTFSHYRWAVKKLKRLCVLQLANRAHKRFNSSSTESRIRGKNGRRETF